MRRSTLLAGGLALTMAVLLVAAALMGRTTEPAGKTVVTVRLWDPQVAAAYRESFDAFSTEHPDIEVRVNTVAYASYFDSLRTDVAGGSADDIFWISNAYFAGYADNGHLLDIAGLLGPQAARAWEPSVVDQFTRHDTLWGVPQLTDAGIAVYYNADLLGEADVDPADLATLRWSNGPDDTLRALLTRLTVDQSGRTAATPGFDADRTRQWGYNAANDLQGIYLNYIGSAGGVFSDGDRFAFDNPQAVAAFEYLVRLINIDRVAPPASDTNGNGDFSRNAFLAGRMALFQSGTYNLAAIADQARFRWGVTMLPIGPKGRVSVTNGIAAAANAATRHPEAVKEVLAWMASRRGNEFLGRRGAAIPAVLAAQPVYHEYWASRGVDVSPFFRVLQGPRVPAPGGAGFPAGFEALKPYFDEMFLGRRDVAHTLAEAQQAANTAASR
ncbi:ABC transporter substrate-binding protein [Mycolicibacterium goodii]|uniref:Sugar ABC transporter substrate-binding protein n=1 Tax=Mycolicibacterium goodii TaxID=134601 RepID=A0ABS6HG99_MYCGD|nr:sugar ABC transporter substrate-binding protein [Mycolicibacterium goodii]MBU8821687.1 sugar ABC transporter substrate-binding protein [Mycolicibacterium goodii]MBU8835989.1 sugar ABC transporter substrate-binding protein [Mycolicibacterium goodii]OKH73544.1 sugar ABC transporter substrate-binding protein [Mycobacterium sp. SWH-M5]